MYVLEDDKHVIKYHRFCADLTYEPIDSLVLETYMLRELEHLDPGLSHKCLYWSAPDSVVATVA